MSKIVVKAPDQSYAEIPYADMRGPPITLWRARHEPEFGGPVCRRHCASVLRLRFFGCSPIVPSGYRFWERMVERTRASGMDSLDPRMVRIRFIPLTSGANSTSAIASLNLKRTFPWR